MAISTREASQTDYAHPEVLVSTGWVADHLGQPGIKVVEVDVDTTAYDQGHVKGAIGLDWRQDLQARPVRDLLAKEDLEKLLSQKGISADDQVIVYGDNNNWFAAWFVWNLKYYGHKDARLMNGGRKKWQEEGRDLVTDAPAVQPTTYRAGTPDRAIRALRDDVFQALHKPDTRLVDVRSPKEFSGELLAPEGLPQEGAQRGGHIPGAANIPWAQAVREDGTFKPAGELRELYGSKGITPDKQVIAYCRIGERSSHTWFVLHYLLGYPNVRNYDGSWTEWGSLIGAPIER
ncbi:MAG TPA: sulfurtransferase [Candidatus Limnocylindrales bacterium]|nr:sulfurtransferase [Candidatus Limnocylindrales bacterium]